MNVTIQHRPYFTSEEVARMSEKQRGKLSVAKEEERRAAACAFIDAVGARMGFPRRTLATAQNLYHRFHLFFPLQEFPFHEVALTVLLVASKLNDTIKKSRDLLLVSYAVRFPELVKGPGRGGGVGVEMDVDPATVEADRKRLLSIERLVLETVCFNFELSLPFAYVVKFGRALGVSKELTRRAWRMAVDSFRTLAPLQFPPHTIALASLYLAGVLASHASSHQAEADPQGATASTNGQQGPSTMADEGARIVKTLGYGGRWEEEWAVDAEDVEEVAHHLLDLFINFSSTSSLHTSPTSPASPASPAEPSLSFLSSSGAGGGGAAGATQSLRPGQGMKPRLSTNVPLSLIGETGKDSGPPSTSTSVTGKDAAEWFTAVKIRLRKIEEERGQARQGGPVKKRRKTVPMDVIGAGNAKAEGDGAPGAEPGAAARLGGNEGSVRFLFGEEN